MPTRSHVIVLITALATLSQCLDAQTAAASQQAEATTPLLEKTLVAWVYPTNLDQQGGSLLTLIDMAEHFFDAIVLGEIARGKWMAGSDFYRRTQQDQAHWPFETADSHTLGQLDEASATLAHALELAPDDLELQKIRAVLSAQKAAAADPLCVPSEE